MARWRFRSVSAVASEVKTAGSADEVDACILTEPSALQPIVAHKGFVWAELRTEQVIYDADLDDYLRRAGA